MFFTVMLCSCSFSLGFCVFCIYKFMSKAISMFLSTCFWVFNFFLICSCCQTSPLFIWFLGLCFLFIVCPSVALCCLVFVSYLCLQLHSNCFFCKVPHHFSKTFWLRSKASIANEQDTCHEAKPHENPNENLSESPFKENIIL